MARWTDSLTAEMIPEQYRPLAEILGVQKLLVLAEEYGGANVYIPKPEALIRTARDKQIREKFNGYNAERLAQDYGLTVRWVQEICKDGPQPGQITLFDTPDSWMGSEES